MITNTNTIPLKIASRDGRWLITGWREEYVWQHLARMKRSRLITGDAGNRREGEGEGGGMEDRRSIWSRRRRSRRSGN